MAAGLVGQDFLSSQSNGKCLNLGSSTFGMSSISTIFSISTCDLHREKLFKTLAGSFCPDPLRQVIRMYQFVRFFGTQSQRPFFFCKSESLDTCWGGQFFPKVRYRKLFSTVLQALVQFGLPSHPFVVDSMNN